MMWKKIWPVLGLTAVLLTVLPGTVFAAGTMQLRLSPATIQTGASFAGADVTVSGRVPPGSQVFVRLMAAGGPVTMTEKGRQGLFWLNQRTVKVTGLPAFYLVLGSTDIARLPSGVQRQMGITGAFGELVRAAGATSNGAALTGAQSAPFLQTLIDLEKQKGLYQERTADFDLAPDGAFSYRFLVPRDLPPGAIQVQAWAVRDGSVVATAQTAMAVQRVGLGGQLAALAQNQAGVYGVLALLAALTAGVAINFLFAGIEGLTRSALGRRVPVRTGKEDEVREVRI